MGKLKFEASDPGGEPRIANMHPDEAASDLTAHDLPEPVYSPSPADVRLSAPSMRSHKPTDADIARAKELAIMAELEAGTDPRAISNGSQCDMNQVRALGRRCGVSVERSEERLFRESIQVAAKAMHELRGKSFARMGIEALSRTAVRHQAVALRIIDNMRGVASGANYRPNVSSLIALKIINQASSGSDKAGQNTQLVAAEGQG